MFSRDIPLDKAVLLSALLEGVLYGFSLLMFGGTIWALLSRRSTCRVNRRMLTVACLLLLISTVHFVINIVRVMEGFVLYQGPGGSNAYFADTSQPTFVCMSYLFVAQTLIGDGVVLYRCYVVWQSKLLMVLPALLWCSVGLTGIGSTYALSHMQKSGVPPSQWIVSFGASSLVTNVLTTLLLAFRIWYVDRRATKIYGPRKSQLRPMLYIIVDAGVIYSLTLLVALICFLCQSDFQIVLLYMVPPVISITFYMVIIRAGLVNRAQQVDTPFTSADVSLNADRRLKMQVHITRLTESKVENDLLSSPARVKRGNHHRDDKRISVRDAVWPRAKLNEPLARDAETPTPRAPRERKRSSQIDICDEGGQLFLPDRPVAIKTTGDSNRR